MTRIKNTVILAISKIVVGHRRRKLDQAKVEALTESIEAIGLQHPIAVYTDAAGIHLVSGAHRLAAVKKLRWGSIEAVKVPYSNRELWEIDENLMRAELSVDEEREHLIRRKELWDKRQAESLVAHDAPDGEKRKVDGTFAKGNAKPKGFASETAALTGKSKSQINRRLACKKPKTKTKTKRQREIEVLQQERDRDSQLMRQQWVAEGHSLKGVDPKAVGHWENAWHDAHTKEEREAWLAAHPADDALPWYECQMTDAQREKYYRWRKQREPASQERVLALKSLEHLSLLKAAWGAADQDARDKFRLYLAEVDRGPEAA
jgi:hypothetical protein